MADDAKLAAARQRIARDRLEKARDRFVRAEAERFAAIHEREAAAVAAHDAGMTDEEIAAVFGIVRRHVSRWRARARARERAAKGT